MPAEDALLVVPRAAPGTMSPTLEMAIPTPLAVQSRLHHWESAEVLQYDPVDGPKSPRDQNQFMEATGSQRNPSNPFFSAREHASKPIPSPPSRSPSNPKSPPFVSPKLNKGKQRAIEPADNPFGDEHRPLPAPLPPISAPAQHTTSASHSSTGSQERALQSLLAVLNIPEAEVQARLRVASMQPSVISAVSSAYTEEDDLGVTGSFPLPPSTPTQAQMNAHYRRQGR
jgi:hypothetical protein